MWDESHYFDFTNPSVTSVEFNIMDKDKFSKDDKMGTGNMSISDIDAGARRVPLYRKGEPAGDLLVDFKPSYPSSPVHPDTSYSFSHSSHPSTSTSSSPPLTLPVTQPPHGPLRSLRLTVKEGRDLPSEGGLSGKFGKVDPFVKYGSAWERGKAI